LTPHSAYVLSEGIEIPIYSFNTVIVGAGAAGMNCAVHLHEFMAGKGIEHPEQRIAIVTAGAHLGASRMSGSDKQTYYKLGTSPTVADSAMDFAKTLTAFGCCHGDVALAEGESALREFYHLVQAGVPFPHDPEGAYIGYKTDHDPYERATSAGPKTSKYMSECLQRQTDRYGIRVFDGQELAHIIKSDGPGFAVPDQRLAGIITIDAHHIDNPAFGLTVFLCENLVLAAGGPGELYEVSVYPEGQTGIHGLALAAGLKAHNLTESQFGLASTKFRWNVSGTYMQVVPRIFSTPPVSPPRRGGYRGGDDEREFLTPHFDSTAKMATNIFLKGYQWPFDPQRILDQQSSLIDVLVYYETQVLGRRVFMDFTRNPIPGESREPFDLNAMDEEALTYLQRNAALQPTPIKRLEHMNPLAIDIYSEHGIDIRTEPLEINVCAQHHNGGFVVDKWWQSSIPHTFVIGEMAGTHGVKRPGGSALNAGQAGGLRAAEYIANTCGTSVSTSKLSKRVKDQIACIHQKAIDLTESAHGPTASEAISAIQRSMSLYGGHIRQLETAKSAKEDAVTLYKQLRDGEMKLGKRKDLLKAIRAEHLALAQVAFLDAIIEYIKSGGGSRGSFMVIREDGDVISDDLINPATDKPFTFVPENEELRATIAEVQVKSVDDAKFEFTRVPVRPIPVRDDAFELAWAAFRNGEVYRR
jgi:succinate dehydrogenase/fumarate reductase flavoprotein subunit